MIKIALLAMVVVFMLSVALNMSQTSHAQGKSDDAQLAHMVYFSLKDNSPQACQKLIDACKKYLSKHEGEIYFSAGLRAVEFKRDVNDQEFDVALIIVFQSKAAHDKYQDHPRHIEFINENKANWKKVRVFDSYVGR